MYVLRGQKWHVIMPADARHSVKLCEQIAARIWNDCKNCLQESLLQAVLQKWENKRCAYEKRCRQRPFTIRPSAYASEIDIKLVTDANRKELDDDLQVYDLNAKVLATTQNYNSIPENWESTASCGLWRCYLSTTVQIVTPLIYDQSSQRWYMLALFASEKGLQWN